MLQFKAQPLHFIFNRCHGKDILNHDFWNSLISIVMLFSFSSAAQPITSKLDDSWWAYKDVVQGSFVPGKKTPISSQ